MKTITMMLLTTVLVHIAKAQDIITKNDSSKVTATVLEINPTDIKFKLFDYTDGPKITTRKSEIAYIVYRNGVVERFQKSTSTPKYDAYQSVNKYNLDNVPVTMYASPEAKIKKCEKLYTKKNYLGFNYIAFLNTALGFNYMRDVKKANMIINVPFAFGLGSPSITSSLYSRNYTDNTSTTKYDLLKYQVGVNALFAPSMNREVNFLMGPSFNFSEYRMSVDTKYTTVTAGQNEYNDGRFKNQFNLRREHYGVNVGFLARFSEKINMNMLITFGYKKDTYNEKDPYGIESINSNARYTVTAPENVMPYVNFAWSIGYRF
jgi:hypothetical protein